jgi:hypothetical protein
MSKSNVSRIQITGPLALYASGFAAELSRVGYAASSRDHQLWLLAHLTLISQRGMDRGQDEGREGPHGSVAAAGGG